MAEDEGRTVSTYETYVSSPNERTVLLVRPRIESWQDRIGIHEMKNLNFWKYVLLEFIITLLFTMAACGSTFNDANNALNEGIAVGFLVAVLICIASPKSGYFNPALSFGLLMMREMKFTRFFFYLVAQMLGSLAGAGLLYLYTPKDFRGNLGVVSLHADIHSGVGFIMEMTLTFIIMWTVLKTTQIENKFTGFQSPLAIGSAVIIGILTGHAFTGAALNPIRAFGPGIIMNHLDNHWIYWVGPFLGALLAAMSFEYVFKLKKENKQEELPTVQLHINANSSTTTL